MSFFKLITTKRRILFHCFTYSNTVPWKSLVCFVHAFVFVCCPINNQVVPPNHTQYLAVQKQETVFVCVYVNYHYYYYNYYFYHNNIPSHSLVGNYNRTTQPLQQFPISNTISGDCSFLIAFRTLLTALFCILGLSSKMVQEGNVALHLNPIQCSTIERKPIQCWCLFV